MKLVMDPRQKESMNSVTAELSRPPNADSERFMVRRVAGGNFEICELSPAERKRIVALTGRQVIDQLNRVIMLDRQLG